MKLVIKWFISAIAIIITGYILRGIHVADFRTALLVALVLGAINVTIKPLLIILTLPITIITLGIFLLIINALLIQFTAYIVPGFKVESFLWAVLFSIVLTIIHSILNKVIE